LFCALLFKYKITKRKYLKKENYEYI
jgi:hypothetical protein